MLYNHWPYNTTNIDTKFEREKVGLVSINDLI